MLFEVNKKEYFLTFAEDEQRLDVISSTPAGSQKIPLYVDATKWERIGDREKRAPRIQ